MKLGSCVSQRTRKDRLTEEGNAHTNYFAHNTRCSCENINPKSPVNKLPNDNMNWNGAATKGHIRVAIFVFFAATAAVP